MTGTLSEKRRFAVARWVSPCAGLLLAVCCTAGCMRSQYRTVCAGGDGAAASGTLSAAPLAEATRGTISPDVSAVRTYEELDPPGIAHTLLAAPSRYRALDAETCRRRAASNSVLANLLDGERRAIAAAACSDPCGAALRSDLLALRARDERNRSAGAALELFHRLAEAEAGRDAVRRNLRHVDQALDDIDALRKKGLPVGVDATSLQRQRIELRERGEETARSLVALNLQLARLVDLDADAAAAIWPTVDWRAEYRDIDIDEAVARGLAERADLALLRRLDGSPSAAALPAARGTLMQVDPMLGQPNVPAGRLARMLGNQDDAAEAAIRRGQIRLLLADRERAAADEIRQAVTDVDSRYRDVALAKDMLASWNGRLRDVREQRAAGDVGPFVVQSVEGEAMRAEHEIVSAIVALRIADVRLRQAQGRLAEERLDVASSPSLPLE